MLSKHTALLLMHKTNSAGIPLLQRVLAGVAAILVLSLMASVLGGALVIGGLYFFYMFLVQNGLDPQAALGIQLAIIFLLAVLLLIFAFACVKNMRIVIRRSLASESPISYYASSAVHAFVDGLLGRDAA